MRARGFDHTTQGSFAVAAGVSKALGLDEARIANAIAICGTAFNALRVTRTGALSHWKGLAYPNTAFGCVYATFLAMRGVTGPRRSSRVIRALWRPSPAASRSTGRAKTWSE